MFTPTLSHPVVKTVKDMQPNQILASQAFMSDDELSRLTCAACVLNILIPYFQVTLSEASTKVYIFLFLWNCATHEGSQNATKSYLSHLRTTVRYNPWFSVIQLFQFSIGFAKAEIAHLWTLPRRKLHFQGKFSGSQQNSDSRKQYQNKTGRIWKKGFFCIKKKKGICQVQYVLASTRNFSCWWQLGERKGARPKELSKKSYKSYMYFDGLLKIWVGAPVRLNFRFSGIVRFFSVLVQICNLAQRNHNPSWKMGPKI